MGVSALAISAILQIRKARPEAEVYLFVGNRSSESFEVRGAKGTVHVKTINYRLRPLCRPGEHAIILLLLAALYHWLPFAKLRACIKRANRRLHLICDAAVVADIRGGDGLTETYGVRNLLVGSLPFLIAYLLGHRPILLPQTYGPFHSPIARSIARFTFRRASRIFCRDHEGANVVAHFGALSTPVRFCPDVAFSLEGVPADTMQISPRLSRTTVAPVIGFNISGLLYHSARANPFALKFSYREFVAAIATRLLEETHADLVFIPHTFAPTGHPENDPDACNAVLAQLSFQFPGRVHQLQGRHAPMQLKSLIGSTEFFIGSRMHACIAALSQGIPTVGLAYSPKFQGVFDAINAGAYVIDARESDPISAADAISSLFQTRNSIRPHLHLVAGKARYQVSDTFSQLFAAQATVTPTAILASSAQLAVG